MAATLALFVAVSTVSWDRSALVQLGGDPARGHLVILSADGRFDPQRPTVVFVHGFNPMPRTVHFTMAEQLAGAIARRGGLALNVLGWNWNAATFAGMNPGANSEAAVIQGRALAATLWQTGASPTRTHLIGHSSGCIVAASAAQALAAWRREPVAQLTLLEPASFYHDVVFDQLGASQMARRVENYWAPGPSGYGRDVPHAGVQNLRVTSPTPILGTVWLLRSSHLHVVHWYIATAGDPHHPGGFNTSTLLAEGN